MRNSDPIEPIARYIRDRLEVDIANWQAILTRDADIYTRDEIKKFEWRLLGMVDMFYMEHSLKEGTFEMTEALRGDIKSAYRNLYQQFAI